MEPPEYGFKNMSEYNFTAGDVKFNKAGMGGILNAANMTLNVIFPKYNQYVGYALNWEDLTDLNNLDIRKLVTDNKGPIAVLVLAAITAIIVTLVGLGWCFMRCCCRDKGCCSSKSDDEVRASKIAKKSDKYKRAIYGIFFAAFVILFTFGLVSCFVTNQQIRDNVNNLPSEADKGLVDAKTYINASGQQMEELLVTNYDKLATYILSTLDESGVLIKNRLAEKTGAQALSNLTDIVDTVDNVWRSVKSVQNSSRELKELAGRLKSGLSKAKNDLLPLLDQCGAQKCIELKNTPEIRSLRVENDFENLPDMTEILRELGNFFGTNVRESVDRGRREFDGLGVRIQSEINPKREEVRKTVEEVRVELKGISKNLTDALNTFLPEIHYARIDLGVVDRELKKYLPYWYYSVLIICCSLTFIFALMAFGIFVGFCGKQPGSEYSNECCSRKTGSSFINCGIFSIFMTFLLLTLVALLHFIVAGIGGQIICEALESFDNQTESALYKGGVPKLKIQSTITDKAVNEYQLPTINQLLQSCRADQSVYQTFRLEPVYNIENLKELEDRFSAFVVPFADHINIPADSVQNIVFLTDETKEQMNRFAQSKITRMKFDNFADQLSEAITSVDLQDVIERINRTINEAEPELIDTEIKSSIKNDIMFLEALKRNVLDPMVDNVQSSVKHLRSLSKDLKDLASRIRHVAQAAETAQRALHDSAVSQHVQDISRMLVEDVSKEVGKYATHTYEHIKSDVGQCGPMYNAYNSTLSAVCVNIISPVGGYWFALSFLLILFIPILIIGCSLAGLYSKYKVGGYESVSSIVHSATYYSSAYGDGDTIPLSLSANNARRHKRGRANEARYSNRFDDTSHKAWGSQMAFNNHHTPPASGEYERPPPYYYPGPAQS